MKKVYYEETYGRYYETDAENPEEEIRNLICEGKESGPDNCVDSVAVELIGNGDPQYQIMGAKIDALSDSEKQFYLWHLLRYYYEKELLKGREKYKDNASTVDQINHILNNVEEIDTLLTYDLF